MIKTGKQLATAVLALATTLAASTAQAQPPEGLVHHQTPVYPILAQRHGVEGWVRMELTVDPSGKVARARVVESQPQQVFDRAAVRAARQWRFEPSEADPAPRQETVRVEFAL